MMAFTHASDTAFPSVDKLAVIHEYGGTNQLDGNGPKARECLIR
jgi:hypothetical protein